MSSSSNQFQYTTLGFSTSETSLNNSICSFVVDSEIIEKKISFVEEEGTHKQINLTTSPSDINSSPIHSIVQSRSVEGFPVVVPNNITVYNHNITRKLEKMKGKDGNGIEIEPIDLENYNNEEQILKLKSNSDIIILPINSSSTENIKQKYNGSSTIWPQVLAAVSVSFGNMIIGLVSAYSSPALASMSMPNSTFSIDIDGPEASWISSLMPLAALVGGILGGPLIERFGRKGASLMTAFPALSAWLLIALASNMLMIYFGRIIAGLCVGITSLSLPVYLAEVVQPQVRGILGLLPTTIGNAGILICYVAGMFLDWKELAYLCGVLSIPFLVCIAIIPESPRWLLVKGRNKEAEASLQWLRGSSADISIEMEEIKTTYLASLKLEDGGTGRLTWKDLTRKAYTRPLYVALGLMALQQLCGINPVIFYTVYIFKTAGTSLDHHICAIIIGIANFTSTFAANLVIDKIGRKILLIISDILMTISLLILATFFYLKEYLPDSIFVTKEFGWIPLVSFIIFVIAFSLGLGPVPWIMTAEIFPMRIRSTAVAITTAFHWILTFGIVKIFPYFIINFGSYTAFYLCSCVCIIGLYFIIKKVPETKGRSLEQIERKLLRSKPKKGETFGPNGLLF